MNPKGAATGPSARVIGSDAARAVGRFNPKGPDGYRAASMPDAPLRATRAEAVNDETAYLAACDFASGVTA